jgi:PAS domain S-box-containing protein
MSAPLSRQWSEAIVHASPDPILVFDANFVCHFASPAFRDTMGYDESTLTGMGAISLIHPDDRHMAGARLEDVLRKGGVAGADIALRVKHRSGEWQLVEAHFRALSTGSGESRAALFMRRSGRERRSVERALLESEARYRELFENANDIIYTMDLETRFTSANRAAEALLGYSREELLTMRAADIIAPEDMPGATAALSSKLSGAAEQTVHEVTLIAKDGRRIRVENSSRLIVRDGTPVGAQGIARDMTARKAAEGARQERFELERQLQEARRAESLVGLAGGIAHEFNNLLVGILGNAGLALMELPDSSPARETIEEMEAAARRAATLAQQMLAYSGRGRFVLEPLDLAAVAARATEPLDLLLPRGAALRLSLPADLPPINGDAAQIRQVVVELVTNAIEALAGAPGEVCVRAEVVQADSSVFARCHMSPSLPAGQYVKLEVRDSGGGIDAEVRGRMFEPFVSTKPNRRGLGLAVVLGIVRGHRGALLVESAPGGGSTFSVFLAAARTD